MKKLYFLKTMLLLCALVAGSSCVWADGTNVVDFESELAMYSDWSFTDLTRTQQETTGSGNKQITTKPHGGSYFVITSQGSSYAVTAEIISQPVSLVCYYTKISSNTNTSSVFKIQVSDNGSNWTDVSSGKTMNNVTGGTWEELSADLSNYSNVYVRVYYSGTTAVRALDDITLTYIPESTDPSSNVSFVNATPTLDFRDADTFTQTATTVSGYSSTEGASVTYTITSNTAGASINENTGEVTPTTTGSVTVKATAAAIAGHYSQSTASYILTVNDSRNAAGLAYAVETQVVYVDDVLSAPTLTNPNNLSVTYSSDDESVATVDTDGNVTGVAKGSTTITATFAGNRSNKPGSASYTITVKPAVPIGQLFYESASGYTSEGDNTNGISTTNINLDSDNWASFDKVFLGGTSNTTGIGESHLKFGNSSSSGKAVTKGIPLTGSGILTYKVLRFNSSNNGTLNISVTGATASGDLSVSGTSAWVEKTVYLTEANGNVVITFETASSDQRIRLDEISVLQLASVNLAEECTDGEKYYGTYSSSKAFKVPSDLSISEIKVVSGKLQVTNYSTDDIVPANTGVMVSATKKGLHTMLLATGGTSILGSDNMLKPSGDAGISAANMAEANTQFYRLTMHNGTDIGFWWGAAEGAAFSIAANKAYLAVPTGSSVRQGLWFNDEVSGISSMYNSQCIMHNEVYDLQGRRVESSILNLQSSILKKGLYIVNGKKVIK